MIDKGETLSYNFNKSEFEKWAQRRSADIGKLVMVHGKVILYLYPVLPCFRIEVYFYDLEGALEEDDDPMKAVMFYWPKALSEDHVVLTAGHLAAVFQFLDQNMNSSSESEIETDPSKLL